MRQAMARGRAVGPHPGRVDVRGKVGASRAIQAALLAATDRSPAGLAAVLAAVIADGDPWRDLHPLFDLPAHPAGTSVSAMTSFPGAAAAGGVLVRAGRRGPVESLPLFGPATRAIRAIPNHARPDRTSRPVLTAPSGCGAARTRSNPIIGPPVAVLHRPVSVGSTGP